MLELLDEMPNGVPVSRLRYSVSNILFFKVSYTEQIIVKF